ncbi:MAG: hypothetical protein O3C28_09225 [Proteobacteria bacterium]|nr:hypothetical protein [Pseudomonadota bacterium]
MATGSGNAVERALNAHDRTVSLNYQIPHCLILLVIILFHGTAFAQSPSITGRWKLDHDASTDSADELKGIRKSKVMPHRDPEPIVDSGGLGNTQKRYWQYANEGDEWRRSRELVHAGPLQRLLESNNLEIVADQDGYLFIYADGYERKVVPNPGGRVFTANGDELVQTAIGFTLAYWKDDVLVFETRIEKGGRLNEWVSVSPDGQKLSLRIEIDNRDWKWIAKINRLYDRVSGNDS